MNVNRPQSYKGVRNVQDSIPWELSEKYLDSGGPFIRLDLEEGEIVGHSEPSDTSVLFYVLKGLTLIVIFIPIIAICTREYFRHKHRVTLLKAEAQSLTEQMLKESFLNPRNNLFTENKAPSILNAGGQIAQLHQSLLSIHNYSTEQFDVLEIVRNALQALTASPKDTERQHFAKLVLKTISTFLRKHTEKEPFIRDYEDYLEGGERWIDNGRYPSFYFPCPHIYEDETSKYTKNHVLICHLLKNLRKLVKLHCKPEKIRERLKQHPEFAEDNPDLMEHVLSLMKINWVHGSKAVTIKSACEKTEGKLVPSGILRRQNIHTLSGANDTGSSHIGINLGWLSGVGLARAEIAIDRYSSSLESFSIESELQRCQQIFRDEPYSIDFLDNEGLFTRKVLAFSRLKGADPEKFELLRERLKARIQVIKEADNQFILEQYGDRLRFLNPSSGKMEGYYSFSKSLKLLEKIANEPATPKIVSEEDIKLSAIPLAMASNNRFGFPIPVVPFNRGVEEEAFPGTLKFGEDVQYAFTEPEHIETVAELVERYNLGGRVHVLPFELLHLARKAEVHVRKYLNDIYSIKKWRSQTTSRTATLYFGTMEM